MGEEEVKKPSVVLDVQNVKHVIGVTKKPKKEKPNG